MSVEDYLILDCNSKDARYEYLDGDLRMLAGGSTYHSRIAANFSGILYKHLENNPCSVFSSDTRLQLSEARYVYPDVTVSCDPRDQELSDSIRYPRLIVEVLSPSTEAIDRGKKFLYYLRNYQLIFCINNTSSFPAIAYSSMGTHFCIIFHSKP